MIIDIGKWLADLGLPQYEPAFHDNDNDIDAGLLAELASEDLKDIGVTSVGHRRKSGFVQSLTITSGREMLQQAAEKAQLAFKIAFIEHNMLIARARRSTCSAQFRAENTFSAAC